MVFLKSLDLKFNTCFDEYQWFIKMNEIIDACQSFSRAKTIIYFKYWIDTNNLNIVNSEIIGWYNKSKIIAVKTQRNLTNY